MAKSVAGIVAKEEEVRFNAKSAVNLGMMPQSVFTDSIQTIKPILLSSRLPVISMHSPSFKRSSPNFHSFSNHSGTLFLLSSSLLVIMFPINGKLGSDHQVLLEGDLSPNGLYVFPSLLQSSATPTSTAQHHLASFNSNVPSSFG